MALTPSPLSLACRSVADFLSATMQAGETIEVLLGTPAAASQTDAADRHRLNLFFYGLEPSGFDSQSLPGLPWRLRLRCLITPFAIDEPGTSAGENDLRILGEAIRVLHEQPILDPVSTNGDSFRLHAVFEPLDLDSLNRLWTTQGGCQPEAVRHLRDRAGADRPQGSHQGRATGWIDRAGRRPQRQRHAGGGHPRNPDRATCPRRHDRG